LYRSSDIEICESDNENSIIEFDNAVAALQYPIDDKHLGDIFGDMNVIFRTF